LVDARARVDETELALPEPHVALLSESNGVTGYDGYFRLFGLSGEVADIVRWNRTETWKFAWPDAVSAYLCFGETAWGDQYAYRLDELDSDEPPRVFFLESVTLQPDVIARDFEAFLRDEFLANCDRPYDELLLAAHERLGGISPQEHLIYSPSPLITGSESLDHVVKMAADAAMIVNGDLATQLLSEPHAGALLRLDPYEDELGRFRLRAVWTA
jgi:hypothetical protein